MRDVEFLAVMIFTDWLIQKIKEWREGYKSQLPITEEIRDFESMPPPIHNWM